MSNKILQAARMAQHLHQHQVRKWTNQPYISHPARVASAVTLHPVIGEQEDNICIAWLHDTFEDCDVDQELVEIYFGANVRQGIVALTNIKIPGLLRADQKKLDRKRLVNAPWHIKVIKMIDRIDNLTDMDKCCEDQEFKIRYRQESLLLVEEALFSVDRNLYARLVSLCSKEM